MESSIITKYSHLIKVEEVDAWMCFPFFPINGSGTSLRRILIKKKIFIYLDLFVKAGVPGYLAIATISLSLFLCP